eukprot:COSAG01_NODE_60607_length_293_cov_28.536082_1_plen_45_part_01
MAFGTGEGVVGHHAGLNSEARDWRIAYKQSFLAKSQESAKQESGG